MPRKAAKVTQADISRAGRAARDMGPDYRIRVEPDGAIIIYRDSAPAPAPVATQVAPEGGWRL